MIVTVTIAMLTNQEKKMKWGQILPLTVSKKMATVRIAKDILLRDFLLISHIHSSYWRSATDDITFPPSRSDQGPLSLHSRQMPSKLNPFSEVVESGIGYCCFILSHQRGKLL